MLGRVGVKMSDKKSFVLMSLSLFFMALGIILGASL